MRSDSELRCRVCGYKSENPPWGDDGKSPLYDFCQCCGVEHGYQDASPTGARLYRSEWIRAGAKWDNVEAKPSDWNLSEQLSHLPVGFE